MSVSHTLKGTPFRPACTPALAAASPHWEWPEDDRTLHHVECRGRRSGARERWGRGVILLRAHTLAEGPTCFAMSCLLSRNHWSLLRNPGNFLMTSSSSTRQAYRGMSPTMERILIGKLLPSGRLQERRRR